MQNGFSINNSEGMGRKWQFFRISLDNPNLGIRRRRLQPLARTAKLQMREIHAHDRHTALGEFLGDDRDSVAT